MKKGITALSLVTISLLFSLQASAQIKGLFEKEEPVFNATLLPGEAPGSVKLVFYFTHSKANSIEASVWVRDEGTGMSMVGSNRLVRGLKETYNRQQDTIMISGLNEQHFYTFGVDYRTPGFMSSKFDAAILKSNYRYESQQASPVVKTEQPAQEMVAQPCQNPDLYVQIKTAGYCGVADRPAVEIQCMNCQGKDWEFDVQLRTATTSWVSLRADGQAQAASGNGIRIEPLCTYEPGTYYVRVLAKGANCPNPITHNVNSFVTITDRQATMQERSVSSVVSPIIEKDIPILPDTCIVRAQAVLQGKVLKGTLQLANGSACSAFYPYAVVHYIHPGHRDLASKPIALIAGASVPFELLLDDQDLSRNIHTLQVVSYARQQAGAEGIPMSAFWIKANDAASVAANVSSSQTTTTTVPQQPVQNYDLPKSNIPDNKPTNTQEIPYEDISLTEDFQTISVKASDPNCNQIQDLNVVFFNNQLGQGDRPLYVTWMNPRCCQEDGCKYTIWAGENPDKLRILVEGSKRGVFIRELLQDLLSTDTYIEVSVKTENGNRKAAYVLGEGAMYGIEPIADYRDRLRPQQSDALMAQVDSKQMPTTTIKEAPVASPPINMDHPSVGGDLANRGGIVAAYEKPQKDIANYSPCKYAREILIVGDRPSALGNQIKIQYDFSDPAYRYTLYLQPEGATDWVLAPGTKESQENPIFNLNITPLHAGKYAILVHKATSTWGCLAAPLDQAIEIKVSK